MTGAGNPVYEPEGPASEALSSWYVRNLVQRAIDQAFRLAPAPADGAPADAADRGRTTLSGIRRVPGV